MTALSHINWKLVLGVTVGSAVGFAYYRLVGCRTGACLITTRWWSATGYGAVVGFLMSRNASSNRQGS